MSLELIKKEIRKNANKEKAKILQRFFKTGPGEYGEDDIFVGVVVPKIRQIARRYKDTSLPIVRQLLKSPVHEERAMALFMLIHQYNKADAGGREKIYEFYLNHTRYINNWDLVDVSAEHIVGAFLSGRDTKSLYSLVKSADLWERRIAVTATFHFIKKNEFNNTLKIAKLLLNDEHDLIHKAVGWMLREIGRRDMKVEEGFLKKYYKKMPRTMLRYAIEKFPEGKRQKYLNGTV